MDADIGRRNMRSNSDHYPEKMVKSVGKTQIRYDVKEVTDGVRTSYDYTYVEVLGEVTRVKIIDAIIADTFSKNAEIAMINNEIVSPGTKKYETYQELRTKAKAVADRVVGPKV